MSIKAAIQCIKKLRADKKFKAKFADAKSAEEKLKIAKAAGFTFTITELKQAREKLLSQLADEQLDAVAAGRAGGAGGTCSNGLNATAACSAGDGGAPRPGACSFGSGDWGGNSAEMASEGIEEVVEMAEL